MVVTHSSRFQLPAKSSILVDKTYNTHQLSWREEAHPGQVHCFTEDFRPNTLFRDKSACFSIVKIVMRRGSYDQRKRQRVVRRRDWVALLRSLPNSRASVAARNRPRNATQVISRPAFCRSNLFSVAAGLRPHGMRSWNKRSYAEQVALELTLI